MDQEAANRAQSGSFLAIIVLLGVLNVGAMIVWLVDRAIRKSRSQFALSEDEPGLWLVVVLPVGVALPYYFYRTRDRSILWGVLGLGAAFGCYVAAVIAFFVVGMLAG